MYLGGLDLRLRARSAGGGVHARWANLVAGWKLDEASDGSAPVARADVLGALELTDNNTTPSAAGIIGNGANFTAANSEFLSHADHAVFDSITGSGGFTICFWLKWTAGVPISKDTGAAGREFLMWVDGSLYVFQTDAISQQVATGHTADSNWHMYTFGWDPSDSKVFVQKDNGARTKSAGTITGLANTTTQFNISSYNGGSSPLTGQVDEVYMFTGAKDEAWVTDMYNAGAGRSYPN